MQSSSSSDDAFHSFSATATDSGVSSSSTLTELASPHPATSSPQSTTQGLLQPKYQQQRSLSAQTASSASLHSSTEDQHGPPVGSDLNTSDLKLPSHRGNTVEEESRLSPSRSSQSSAGSSRRVRPSSASTAQGRRRSSTTSQSSRSKILASSAMSIEGSTGSILPFEYRARTASEDLAEDSGLLENQLSLSPRRQARLSLSPPKQTTRSSITASTSGVLSLAERKRRLASASGNFTLDQEAASIEPASIYSKKKVQGWTKGSEIDSTLSLPRQKNYNGNFVEPSPSEVRPTEVEDVRDIYENRDTSLRASFRNRLFGQRRAQDGGSYETQVGTEQDSRLLSPDVDVATSDDKTESQPASFASGLPSSSSFAALIESKMIRSTSKSSLESIGIPSTIFRRGSRTKKIWQEFQGRGAEGDREVERTPARSTDKENSFFASATPATSQVTHVVGEGQPTSEVPTNLTTNTANDPLIATSSRSRYHKFDSTSGLKSSFPRGESRLGHTSDAMKKIYRTGSWPVDDQEDQSASVTGDGVVVTQATPKPDRERANNTIMERRSPRQARTNAGVDKDNRSFQSMDLGRSVDAERSKRATASGSTLSSPNAVSVDKFDAFVRPHVSRPGSTRSFHSNHDPASPRTPAGKARQTTSEDVKRGHSLASTSSSAMAESSERLENRPRTLSRDSGSYTSSFYSSNSQPTTPIYHSPRSSSLKLNATPMQLTRSSSTKGSFVSAASPRQVKDSYIDEKNGEIVASDEIDLDQEVSRRLSTATVKEMSAAGAAGAGAVAVIRAKFAVDDTAGVTERNQAREPETNLQTSSLPSMLKTDASKEKIKTLDDPSVNSQEPRRPTKSPLRVASGQSTLSVPLPLPRPSSRQQVQDQRVISLPEREHYNFESGSGEKGNDQTRLDRTLERSSVGGEDVMQGDPATFRQDALGRSISSSTRPLDDKNLDNSRLQIAPESARRLVALTRGGKDDVLFLRAENNDSNLSLTPTEEDATADDKPHSSTYMGLASRYKSLRKVSPTALANPFSTKAVVKSSFLPGNVTEEDSSGPLREDGERLLTSSSTPSDAKKKIKKKWIFGKEITVSDGSNGKAVAVDVGESSSDGVHTHAKSGKVGKSLRGRKPEPVATDRPTIRRIFDETNRPDGDDLESNDSDDDELEPVQVMTSKGVMANAIHSPWIAAGVQTKESRPKALYAVARSVEATSGPAVSSTTEDLSPEAKKLAQRRNVIRELVETEKNYASDLAVVRDVYLYRARLSLGIPTPTSTSTSSQAPTPIHSPYGTPSTTTPNLPPSSHLTQKGVLLQSGSRVMPRMTSYDLSLGPPSPRLPGYNVTASPSSYASSSDAGNRSSTYTVSSQNSQASAESSHPFNFSNNSLLLPATPPNLFGLPASSTAATLHPYSPSVNTSTSTFATQRNPPLGKAKLNISTSSLLLSKGSALSSATSMGDAMMTASDVRIIFAHLESCCAFAEDMASILAASMGSFARSKKINVTDVRTDMDKEDDSIGETFLGLMTRIREVYIKYCSQHESSMMKLQEVMTNSPRANVFFRECTELARKQTNAWDLGSLLIKPVQRVLKYPLLLQQIINSTSPTHADYKSLKLAFDEIQGVADEINQVKKRKDLAEHIITGRTKDARTVSGSSTIKGKKKSLGNFKEEEGFVGPVGAEESAMEECSRLMKQFHSLSDRMLHFGPQCVRWSTQLQSNYESQLNVTLALRRVYRLQIEVIDAEGITRIRASKEVVREEEKTLTIYVRLLRNVLASSWRRLDQEMRSTILLMTAQIEQMFDSPRVVMMKRDERLADYQRFRQSLLAGKQPERKVLEGANGFVALTAQLVEDLPQFIRGVQTLLDVGVQAFARLQAIFFDDVHNQMLDYWRSEVKKSEGGRGMFQSTDGLEPPSSNLVRAFWDRHSISASWIDSLKSVQGKRKPISSSSSSYLLERADESDASGSALSTPGLADINVNGILQPSLPIEKRPLKDVRSSGSSLSTSTTATTTTTTTAATSAGNSSSSNSGFYNTNLLTPSNAKRPGGGMTAMLKSISGTLRQDHSNAEKDTPPLPLEAATDTIPPSLPSLKFRDQTDDKGYFALEGVEQEETNKTTPTFVDLFLPNEKAEEGTHQRKSSFALSSFYTNGLSTEERSTTPSRQLSTEVADLPVSAEETGEADAAAQRHRMNVLYQCTATMHSTASPEQVEGASRHLGWPFLSFAKGDTLKVFSSDDLDSTTTLLFGRIDQSGKLGWAHKACF
ncbi:hypothetical protein CBS101457_004473 [Exobasidium rhododendri]|nr:hypothetical protein CBS101457_004473 [Exobasidium rhododendri]